MIKAYKAAVSNKAEEKVNGAMAAAMARFVIQTKLKLLKYIFVDVSF